MGSRRVRELIGGGLSRRRFFRTGGAGVASAVIAGVGIRSAHATPVESAPTAIGLSAADLRAVDPHLMTARSVPLFQVGIPAVRILPIARAKLLAGARFDLRVEALGLSDPGTATIRLEVAGPNGPEPLLVGTPVRSSATPSSLEVTYLDQGYARPGRYRIMATVEGGGLADPMVSAVEHDVVVATRGGKKARNVIFFLGDGMGQGPITAARILSKGISIVLAARSAFRPWDQRRRSAAEQDIWHLGRVQRLVHDVDVLRPAPRVRPDRRRRGVLDFRAGHHDQLPTGANVVPNVEKNPGAELQIGNLPLDQVNSVHTVDDVPIVAIGPGAARFNATLDNTEVFFAIMDALGIDATAT